MKAFIEEVKYQNSNSTEVDVNYPFKENDTYKEVISKISRLQIESIMDTTDKLDEEMIKKAVINILGSDSYTDIIWGWYGKSCVSSSYGI